VPKRGGKTIKNVKSRAIPKWVPFAVAASITLMVCLTVNFRAFSELRQEMDQHQTLNSQIENITSENLSLQEEIHYLKSDSSTIEREAKKFGLARSKEKVSVPANK
jgi:cell division protein FtsL